MYKEKTRGSLGLGILLLVVEMALLSIAISMIVVSSNYQNQGDYFKANFFITPIVGCIFFFLISATCGAYMIYAYVNDHRTYKLGRDSSCRVVEKYAWRGVRTFIIRHRIVVSYKTSSGDIRKAAFYVSEFDFNRLHEGDIVKCRILGNSCFVDAGSIIKLKDSDAE